MAEIRSGQIEYALTMPKNMLKAKMGASQREFSKIQTASAR